MRMLTVEAHGVSLRLDDTGFAVAPYVYQPAAGGRWYEQAFLEHIRRLDRRGAYVDVGAHLGTHTIWFGLLCPSSVVHAIEPVGRYADVLQRNVQANDLQAKVRIHRVGAGAARGTAVNHLSREHQVGFEGTLEEASAVDEAFEVHRLDQIVRGPVAIVKIDVEGMEGAVLEGAAGMLSSSRPVIYVEAHGEDQRAAIERLLAPHGYAPTDRVFNSSPTYEFMARTPPPRRGRPLVSRLPPPVRKALRTVRAGRVAE